MRRYRISGVVLAGLLLSALALAKEPAAEDKNAEKAPAEKAPGPSVPVSRASARKEGIAASRAWLDLVDGGKYAESWTEAAGYFRNAIGQEQWERSIRAVRDPLGKVVSRKLKHAEYETELPGAPDGHYVVIQYQTSFQNKKSAVETVAPLLDRDGRWRVSGYYIN